MAASLPPTVGSMGTLPTVSGQHWGSGATIPPLTLEFELQQSLIASITMLLAICSALRMMRPICCVTQEWADMIRRRMAIGVVGALVVMLAAAFGLLRSNPQPERPLLIWTGRGVSELTAIGHAFTARTGRAVQIESPANFVEKFEILAQQGQGPDIIIWAHDRFGAWQQAGLLLPLHPSPDLQQHCLAQAMAPLQQADSSLLGYPLQLESLVDRKSVV